jgi:hypothetical protein
MNEAGVAQTEGSGIYPERRIESWDQFRAEVAGPDYHSWAFRAQLNAGWPLMTSLSRYFFDFGVDRRAWAAQEERILRVFKRKAHLYLDRLPRDDADFEWLALMQHHGAPTRLLDFTWSPYVAAFFALERATGDSALWALNPPRVSHSKSQTIRGGEIIDPSAMGPWIPGNYERYFLKGDIPFVIIGEPHVMNQRLIAQSGTFVVPGVLDEPLESILADYPEPDKTLTKFVLATDRMREQAMRALYSMNVTYANLMPDLNGLARSMAYELEFHWAYEPHDMRPVPGFESSGEHETA